YLCVLGARDRRLHRLRGVADKLVRIETVQRDERVAVRRGGDELLSDRECLRRRGIHARDVRLRLPHVWNRQAEQRLRQLPAGDEVGRQVQGRQRGRQP